MLGHSTPPTQSLKSSLTSRGGLQAWSLEERGFKSFQGQIKKPATSRKKWKTKSSCHHYGNDRQAVGDGWKWSWMMWYIVYNAVEKISLGCNLDGAGESQCKPQSCGSNYLISHKKRESNGIICHKDEDVMRRFTIRKWKDDDDSRCCCQNVWPGQEMM